MKILLSAIACDPYRGSEAHFGWNALRVWAEDHEVWVLGHEKDSETFRRAREEGLIGDNVRFYPHSQWGQRHRNRIVSRIQNWRDYETWSKQILSTALRLEREVGFDLAHHATLSSWRVGSELWKLKCPFVWGPIGGAEVFPLRLMRILSPSSAAYELLRRAQNTLAFASKPVRACAKKSAHIFASTPETQKMLLRMGCEPRKLSLLSAAFFTPDQIRRFSEVFERKRGRPPSPLHLFAGGDVEGRKGFALAIEALAGCKRRGMDFRYTIAGLGPEKDHLLKMAEVLGIRQNVEIVPPFSGPEYLKALEESHVYLMPSLRDNPSLSLLEAMLTGCVPVVADSGGPGWIVDESCGFRVPVGSKDAMVRELENILLTQAREKGTESDTTRSMLAHRRISEDFSLSHYRKCLFENLERY